MCLRRGTARVLTTSPAHGVLRIRTIQERSRRDGAALCCPDRGSQARRFCRGRVRLRTHDGDPADWPCAWVAAPADSKGARSGASVTLPGMRRERAGPDIGEMAGDELRWRPTDPSSDASQFAAWHRALPDAAP